MFISSLLPVLRQNLIERLLFIFSQILFQSGFIGKAMCSTRTDSQIAATLFQSIRTDFTIETREG